MTDHFPTEQVDRDRDRVVLELRVQVQNLLRLVTELQGSVESHDRSLKWVAIGGLGVLMIIAAGWLRCI